MENHKEKLAIFDQYAKEYAYDDWDHIAFYYSMKKITYEEYKNHIFNATDLVQKEALKRASESASDSLELYNSEYLKLEQSILSENNLIK